MAIKDKMVVKHELSEGYKSLNSDYKQVISNVDEDITLDNTRKQAFYEHVKEYNASECSFADHCNLSFFYQKEHRFLGEESDLASESKLGHIITIELLKSRVGDSLGLDDAASIDDIVRNAYDHQDLEGAGLSEYCIRDPRHTMWAMTNDEMILDKNAKTLNNIPLSDIICICGLEYEGECFFFGYEKAALILRVPTSFDAGLNKQFRPRKNEKEIGGRTLPLDKCIIEYPDGLIELIHKPIKFSDIEELTLFSSSM